MLRVVVLRKEIGGEDYCKNDDGSDQMGPGVDGLVVPLEQATHQRWQGVAHAISPDYPRVEL